MFRKTDQIAARKKRSTFHKPNVKKQRKGDRPGLVMTRHFTVKGDDPYETVKWELRDASIKKADGSIVFEQKGVEFPTEWSQTATVYARGWLHHQGGVRLDEVEWVQGGVNAPGRVEMANLNLPDGVSYTQVTDKSLVDLLLAGEIDCMISAHPPHEFDKGDGSIVRLMPDYREVEEAYFKETGIYPIMHTVAIKRDVYEEYPWIARNLMTAFEEARDRSVARLTGVTASQIPVPWGYVNAERTA